MRTRFLLCCLVAPFFSGCSTMVNGTVQTVAIKSTPSGANCILTREGGLQVGAVASTPQQLAIPKSQKNVFVECRKPGLESAKGQLPSQIDPSVAGNVLVGGLVGGVVDFASGAAYQYPKEVTVYFPGHEPPPEAKKKKPETKPTGPTPGDPMS